MASIPSFRIAVPGADPVEAGGPEGDGADLFGSLLSLAAPAVPGEGEADSPPVLPSLPDGEAFLTGEDAVADASTEEAAKTDEADVSDLLAAAFPPVPPTAVKTMAPAGKDEVPVPVRPKTASPATAPALSVAEQPISAAKPDIEAVAATRPVDPMPVPAPTAGSRASPGDAAPTPAPIAEPAPAPMRRVVMPSAVSDAPDRKEMPRAHGGRAAAPASAESANRPRPEDFSIRALPEQAQPEMGAPTVRPAAPQPAGVAPPLTVSETAPPPLAMPTPAPVAQSMSPASPPPAAPPLPQAVLDLGGDGEWLDQIARDIARSADGDQPLRFRLHPETLGHLKVELTQGQQGASIRLVAESEAARAILADAQPRLVAEARAQGVRIDETRVDVETGGRHAGTGAFGREGGQGDAPGGRRPASVAGRFAADAVDGPAPAAAPRAERYA